MEEPSVDLQLDRAHSARMYDYYLGGRTNFVADREAVSRVMAVFPSILVVARTNREFMHRSTRFLAEHGLRQFLDIGTGIPTRPNLHEVAQGVAPDCRVVYVDNDPIVLAHAKALLASSPEGRTAYIEADLNDPEAILASPVLHGTLDLSLPVALSLNGVLPFITEQDRATAIVNTLKDPLAAGSALAMTHGTSDFVTTTKQFDKVPEIYKSLGTAATTRSRAQFAAFFEGWETVEPGITTTFRWRPDEAEGLYDVSDAEAAQYAAIAFKS